MSVVSIHACGQLSYLRVRRRPLKPSPFFPRCEGSFPPTTQRILQQPHSTPSLRGTAFFCPRFLQMSSLSRLIRGVGYRVRRRLAFLNRLERGWASDTIVR